MKYYILKLYEKVKEENPNVEQGFNRFTKKTKRRVCIIFIIVLLTAIEVILTSTIWCNVGACICGMIIVILSFMLLIFIDNKDEKKNLEKYADSYIEKIEILYNLLEQKFQINTKEKIDELIAVYQEYIEKKKKEEKQRNSIIVTISTSLTGLLVFLFNNLKIIGIGFDLWLYVAVIILLSWALVGGWIYSLKFFETTKKKYEMMIEDLIDVRLIKYR